VMARRRSLSIAAASSNFSNGIGLLGFSESVMRDHIRAWNRAKKNKTNGEPIMPCVSSAFVLEHNDFDSDWLPSGTCPVDEMGATHSLMCNRRRQLASRGFADADRGVVALVRYFRPGLREDYRRFE
jgi:hypothetical protein